MPRAGDLLVAVKQLDDGRELTYPLGRRRPEYVNH